MNCELDFFSYQTNPASFDVPTHKHSCYELVYYVNGRGSTTLNAKKYTYRDHCFSIITPNTQHNEFSNEETNIIYFGFKYDNLPIHLLNGVFSDNEDTLPILHLMEKMKHEVLSQNLHYNLLLNSLITEILIEFDRLYSHKKVEKENSFSYIINFINENYYKQIDLRSLADISCLSYDRFRHLFKEITGFSPSGYIIQTRLKNAKNLLQHSNSSITNIAVNCGFYNASQFSTIFKEIYHISPKDYRKSKRTEHMD